MHVVCLFLARCMYLDDLGQYCVEATGQLGCSTQLCAPPVHKCIGQFTPLSRDLKKCRNAMQEVGLGP